MHIKNMALRQVNNFGHKIKFLAFLWLVWLFKYIFFFPIQFSTKHVFGLLYTLAADSGTQKTLVKQNMYFLPKIRELCSNSHPPLSTAEHAPVCDLCSAMLSVGWQLEERSHILGRNIVLVRGSTLQSDQSTLQYNPSLLCRGGFSAHTIHTNQMINSLLLKMKPPSNPPVISAQTNTVACWLWCHWEVASSGTVKIARMVPKCPLLPTPQNA